MDFWKWLETHIGIKAVADFKNRYNTMKPAAQQKYLQNNPYYQSWLANAPEGNFTARALTAVTAATLTPKPKPLTSAEYKQQKVLEAKTTAVTPPTEEKPPVTPPATGVKRIVATKIRPVSDTQGIMVAVYEDGTTEDLPEYGLQDLFPESSRMQQGAQWQQEFDWQKQQSMDSVSLQREQFEFQKQQAIEARELEKQKLLASLSGPRNWIQYWQQKYGGGVGQGAPPAPGWLKDYVGTGATQAPPQMLQTGGTVDYQGKTAAEWAAIQKDEFDAENARRLQAYSPNSIVAADVITPSGQWLSRTAPTIKEGLAGYADWSAEQGKSRSWEDILGHAKTMLPTRNAYVGGWLPARQWGR